MCSLFVVIAHVARQLTANDQVSFVPFLNSNAEIIFLFI